MGNKKSTELDSQRIAEIATEANGQFAKEFNIAFKDAVVSKIKNAYVQGATKMALIQADVPSQHIRSGYLFKLGANIKNWKRRKFVAMNKSDNYAIVYFEDEEECKEKGRLSCCGYGVESFSAEEVSWYGQYGIKLRSHADAKRVWLFRADNEEDQNQWIEVFMNACKKSKPEVQRDPVFMEAFVAAYRTTRAAYGYFGVFNVIGNECEMLEYLTNQILSREMLDQYILERARTNSVARKNLMVSVHNNTQKIIKPIVSSTWRGSFASAEGMKASFELSVKASLRLVLDKEGEIKTFLQPKIRALVDPYIADLQTKTCMPILKCCFECVVEAYEQALLGFHREVSKVLGSIDFYPDTLGKEMAKLEEVVEQVNSGPLVHSQKVLWKMHTSDLTEVHDVLETSGISGYDLYIRTMDDLKGLLQNAICTFGKLAQGKAGSSSGTSTPPPPPPGADGLIIAPQVGSSVPPTLSSGTNTPTKRPLADVLNEVISKLTADAKVTLQKGLTSFLLNAVECRMQEMMIAPCYEVTLSAQHLVTRETQLMINLNSLGEAMVRDMVHQYIVSLLSDLSAEASSRLNMIAVQVIGDSSSD